MKTRMTIVLGMTVAALALLATSCSGDSAPQPSAAAPPPAAASAEPAQPQQVAANGKVFVFAPETRIEFIGSKPGKDHDGGFRNFDGRITLVDDDPSKSRVDLTIQIDSLWTDTEQLTEHLLGGKEGDDFFQAAKYPTAEFHSTAITPQGEDYLIEGELTMKDVRQPLSFPAHIAVNGDTVTAQAEMQFPRRQFHVEFDGLADKIIYEEVPLKLNITAVPEEKES